jgi:type VI secretion system secreted protein Hcp
MLRGIIRIITVVCVLWSLSSCNLGDFPNGQSTEGEGTQNGVLVGKAKYRTGEDHSGILVGVEPVVDTRTMSVGKAVAGLKFTETIDYSVTTDGSGSYRIDDIEPGLYTLYAYSPGTMEGAVKTGVEIDAGRTITATDLYLTLVGSISGRILLDGTGTDNLGFLVYIAGTSYGAVTDDTGAYTISSVPAGSGYDLVILNGEYRETIDNVTVTAATVETVQTIEPTSSQVEGHNQTAGINCYMTVNGTQGSIEGDVTITGREGTIRVYNVVHDIEVPVDPVTGLPDGSSVHHPLAVATGFSKASPKLQKAMVDADTLEVILEYYRVNESGVEEHFYSVTLQNARIVASNAYKMDSIGNTSFSEMEEYYLTYDTIAWVHEVDSIASQESSVSVEEIRYIGEDEKVSTDGLICYLTLEGVTQGSIEGVAGDGRIPVTGFDHLLERAWDGAAYGTLGPASFTVVKELASDSPMLQEAMRTNEAMSTTKLEFYRDDQTGGEELYSTVELANAIIVSIDAFPVGSVSKEAVGFAYEGITWTESASGTQYTYSIP